MNEITVLFFFFSFFTFLRARFVCFCIRITSGVNICRQQKCYKACYCYKAVVLLLLLYCVTLWFLLRGFACFLFLMFFSVLVSIVITCICLFILYALLSVFYFFLLEPLRLPDCSISWLFHLNFCFNFKIIQVINSARIYET